MATVPPSKLHGLARWRGRSPQRRNPRSNGGSLSYTARSIAAAMNRARKSCHTPPIADASSSAEDGMLHAEGLSTSALLSLWLRSRPPGPLRCSVVRALMSAHGWTSLRAWRHWRGHSKAEMARRLNIHLATYELIEDGTVDLGPWVLPAVEKILLD